MVVCVVVVCGRRIRGPPRGELPCVRVEVIDDILHAALAADEHSPTVNGDLGWRAHLSQWRVHDWTYGLSTYGGHIGSGGGTYRYHGIRRLRRRRTRIGRRLVQIESGILLNLFDAALTADVEWAAVDEHLDRHPLAFQWLVHDRAHDLAEDGRAVTGCNLDH